MWYTVNDISELDNRGFKSCQRLAIFLIPTASRPALGAYSASCSMDTGGFLSSR